MIYCTKKIERLSGIKEVSKLEVKPLTIEQICATLNFNYVVEEAEKNRWIAEIYSSKHGIIATGEGNTQIQAKKNLGENLKGLTFVNCPVNIGDVLLQHKGSYHRKVKNQ